MFKKLIILTAIMLNGSTEHFLPNSFIIDIKGEELKLAIDPINEIMASRFAYSVLDVNHYISFNTIIRNYNFEKGRLENTIDDSLISIPNNEAYTIQQKQMDLFVKLGFFTKFKDYVYIGKDNLKGFYKEPIKVTSNGIIIEESKRISGAQYKITKLGTEHLAKKNEEVLICLGHLKANVLSLIKNNKEENYTVKYKLYLEGTPTWINGKEAMDIFPFLVDELNKINQSTTIYTINLKREGNKFEIIKGEN